MTEATAGTEGPPRSPVREVLGERNFRAFFIAQVLLFGVGGTLRFTFIWLVVTLTDWPSAEGLVAFCLGVPAMLLSVPAGAWSDRLDRRKLFVGGIASTAVMLVVFTAAIAAGWVDSSLLGAYAPDIIIKNQTQRRQEILKKSSRKSNKARHEKKGLSPVRKLY